MSQILCLHLILIFLFVQKTNLEGLTMCFIRQKLHFIHISLLRYFESREKNGCHLPESEEEEALVKRACVSRPFAPKITAPKDSLAVTGSPQPQRQSLNGSPSSSLNAQEPQACQHQTYITMSAPQPTCDRKNSNLYNIYFIQIRLKCVY